MVSVFHVAITGSDSSDGSEARPLRTIDRAAGLARAGDTVVVHEGEYREWVRPRRGGLSDTRRITYRAAAGEHVVVKGSEPVRDWQQVEGPVWTASVPNSVFGAVNLFAEEIDGDWIVYPAKDSPRKHLGDVYLTGAASTRCCPGPRSRTRRCGPRCWTTGPARWTASAIPSRPGTCGTPRSGTRPRRCGRTSRTPTPTPNWSRSTCGAPSSTRPSTTSTTSRCAGSSWPRPPARGPRRPPTSPA